MVFSCGENNTPHGILSEGWKLINKEKCLERYLKKHENDHPECPVCHRTIYPHDLADSEYVKTKRGTEIFIHTDCVKKRAD